MGQYTNFSVSHEHGAMLRELAKHLNTPISALLAEWIDRGCRQHGLGVMEEGAKLIWREKTETFIVSLFGDAYWIELKPARMKAMAMAIEAAIERGQSTALDIGDDGEPHFSVWRRGTGIRLEIDALAKVKGIAPREAMKLDKSMSADAARKIANDMLAGLLAEAVA